MQLPLALTEAATSWWDRLNLAQQLFYGIGLTAGVVAMILVVMALFGMEHDDAVDGMLSSDAHDSGGVFSTKPLTGFFLGFGWVGGTAIGAGWSTGLALLAACAAGAAMMAIILVMFRAILSLRSDGTLRNENALGASGTVYLTIPPKRASGGQVTLSLQGRQETYEALTDSDIPLPSGTKVKVSALLAHRTVVVEAL